MPYYFSALLLGLFLFCGPLFFPTSFSGWPSFAYGQSVMDDLQDRPGAVVDNNAPELFSETLLRISPSKRIILLTNQNQMLNTGDFLSFVRQQQLLARALVAKITENQGVGVKLVKLYQPDLWAKVRTGETIQIIRGDDSYFAKPQEEEQAPKIEGEDDLYNTNLLEDDVGLEENKNRIIKQDNIISVSYGGTEGIDNNNKSTYYGQLGASWSYQVADNIWAEIFYGQNIIRDFPAAGLDTRFSAFTLKGKYTFAGPLYTYFMPYLGLQFTRSYSPGAGVAGDDTNLSDEDLRAEEDQVDKLNRNRFILGITILKRMVPGWFMRADLGLDHVGGGIGLEF